MRTRTVLTIMLSTLVAAAISSDSALSESTRRPTVRVEKGVVINSRAAYSFSLPQGWVLQDDSTPDLVKILHPDSGATFSVSYDHSPGNRTMVYQSFLWSYESSDNKWLSFGKGSVTLGGQPAMGIRGTREKDGKKVKELAWVALMGEYFYLVSSSATLDQFDARAPEIDLMFSSFSWGTPNSRAAPRNAVTELEKGKKAYLKKDLKQAETHFRAAVEIMPDSYFGHLYLGHSIFYQKRFAEAIPEYERAKELGTTPGGMTQSEARLLNDQLGMSYGISGRVEDAKRLFEAAIKEDPGYAMYYYNLACAHAELGNLQEAITNLKLGFDHREDMISGEQYPNPRGDDSFKRYLGNERFEAALKEMGF
jgi:hypothetical protein